MNIQWNGKLYNNSHTLLADIAHEWLTASGWGTRADALEYSQRPEAQAVECSEIWNLGETLDEAGLTVADLAEAMREWPESEAGQAFLGNEGNG